MVLPSVVHEASAAVLVVDLLRREVTYADELAREFAPECPLPVAIDKWSEAAGLEDAGGHGLRERDGRAGGAESLLRIAQGEPVTGEAVTAARATSSTAERETLWVLGLPLEGAPEPMSSCALVVFLPARNARLIAGAQESAVTLRDRAVLATRMSFTITDPRRPDNPLVWVNPAFTATTGYSLAEVVGRNCRFLQGELTDRRVVDDIRAGVLAQQPITTTLLNYRKDGTPFWNELSISPVLDNDGEVTHFVGVQADVTARVEAQQARDAALSQVALAADRQALLADFTSRMALARVPQQVIQVLGTVITPRIGTWCAVFTFDDLGRVIAPYVRHEREDEQPELRELLSRLHAVASAQLPDDGPILRVLRGVEREVLIGDLAVAPRDVTGWREDERTQLIRRIGARSIIVQPLVSRSGIRGCVAVVADDTRPPLGDEELGLTRDLATRAGLMLENSQLYARERAVAETLQRSLLPELPQLPGISVAAEYVPAADRAAVGGDWYDVFALRGGKVGIVVGDVMGHNFDSAALMGKLSTVVRAYAWPGSDPRNVLTAVDELIEGSGPAVLATCCYLQLQLHGDSATVCYSNAGHPPPLVRFPDGRVAMLDGDHGPMMGVARLLRGAVRERPDQVREVPRGSTIICFTDGLVDAFAVDDIDAGLAELSRRVAELPLDGSPDAIVRDLTDAAQERRDDVAVVAIRID
jgi:PAS domain S-box-containing protein